MKGSNGFNTNTWIGGALLILSLGIAAVGIVISLRTGSERPFMIASIPAAVLVVAGGSIVYRSMLPGESRLLLPGGEKTITAEVLGVTRNLRTAGEKTAYYIVCRYKNPLTGKEETFSSRPLEEYPGKEVIGKSVTVHIDPLEKGKYTVEIDPLLEEVRRERAAVETTSQGAVEATDAASEQKPAEEVKEAVTQDVADEAAKETASQDAVEEASKETESHDIVEEEKTGGTNGGTA